MPIDTGRGLDLNALRAQINVNLERYLPDSGHVSTTLVSAMRYSLMAGGKRLRPLLVCAAHHACGAAPDENLWKVSAATEYLHTFSLIHDDLPCMDDDDLRRGQPTCHKKFGEGVAVLAGDALAVRAFELVADTGRADIVVELSSAIGACGMIGGQMADLDAEGKSVRLEDVRMIHQAKTAALFRACARAGGMLATAKADVLAALGQYGEQLGLAFQIVDDMLDVEGETLALGKTAGADFKRGKATFPKASSMAEARRAKDGAAIAAKAALARIPEPQGLAKLLERSVNRSA